ncbi:AraC family transcriptional regulator [Brevundimonas sp. R86498]|uniref:AraC family transcriptional regulator n=1 Tax=Brevundimonas sp. R86498 TaxID=3093845 RepID=UPI0037C5390F
MLPPPLPSGTFLGHRSTTASVVGFKAGLWRASVPPENVHTHTHEDAHFVLAVDGGYQSLAHDRLTPAGHGFGPGALIWNPPGIEHRDSFETVGGRFLSVSFMPPKGAARGEPSRLRHPVAEAAARRLVGAVSGHKDGDAIKLEGLLLDMAAAVLSPAELDEDPAPEWLLRADQALRDLCRQPGLEVQDLARIVGVHPVSLARRYRRHFGISPATAIRRARVDRAVGDLAVGMDLAELAARGGYADQSHLTREFRALYGLTPGRYRAAFV